MKNQMKRRLRLIEKLSFHHRNTDAVLFGSLDSFIIPCINVADNTHTRIGC